LNSEVGMRKAEFGMRNGEIGMRKAERRRSSRQIKAQGSKLKGKSRIEPNVIDDNNDINAPNVQNHLKDLNELNDPIDPIEETSCKVKFNSPASAVRGLW